MPYILGDSMTYTVGEPPKNIGLYNKQGAIQRIAPCLHYIIIIELLRLTALKISRPYLLGLS